MKWSALAPRSLFFKGAPGLMPSVPTAPVGHSLLWWIGVVLAIWFIISVVIGVLIWPAIFRRLGWPQTTPDEEAEALRKNEVERFFKKNQKDNKKKRDMEKSGLR